LIWTPCWNIKVLQQKRRDNDIIQNSLYNISKTSAVKLEESCRKFKKHCISDVFSFASNPLSNMITPSNKMENWFKWRYIIILSLQKSISYGYGDFIHSCVVKLPFWIASHPMFHLLITLEQAVGSNFKFPSRNKVATD
jgi:hypothetical protein